MDLSDDQVKMIGELISLHIDQMEDGGDYWSEDSFGKEAWYALAAKFDCEGPSAG